MPLSNADLDQIIERASTLSERFNGEFVPGASNAKQAWQRLSRWRQLAGSCVPEALNRVLHIPGVGGVTEAELLENLGSITRKAGASWPAWASLLDEAGKCISEDFSSPKTDGHRQERGFGKWGHVPYQQLFEPIAKLAWSRVEEFCPLSSLLASDARRGLQHHLLRRISNVAALPLHTVFLAHNAIRRATSMASAVPGCEAPITGLSSQRQYQTFVANQGEDGLRAFFMRQPVVARLAAELAQLWIEVAREFLGRLEADQRELAITFNDGVPLGKLTHIQAGVSDPHRNGRGVLLLTFDGGLRLAYKPRPMEIDRVFYGLAKEINRANQAPEIGILKVLVREGYGWMEFAPHNACGSRAAVGRYYRRAGALACVLHWLQATDCHRENLVACGEYPMLTDLETTAHPYSAQERATSFGGTPWSLDGSVLRTGLLPLWCVRPTGATLYDNSGIGAPVLQRSPMPTIRWEHLNTDQMEYRHGHWLSHHHAHLPFCNRRAVFSNRYSTNILGGYTQMAKLLSGAEENRFIEWRDRAFATVRRRIKRPTLVYAYILQASLSPENLSEGVDRSIALHALPRLDDDDVEQAAEITSLERLDIPYFQFGTNAANPATGTPSPDVPDLFNQRKVIRLSLQRELRLEQAAILPVRPRSRPI